MPRERIIVVAQLQEYVDWWNETLPMVRASGEHPRWIHDMMPLASWGPSPTVTPSVHRVSGAEDYGSVSAGNAGLIKMWEEVKYPEFREACDLLIEEGGPDYDGSSVNPVR
jgi:hypothetical protein